MESFANYNGHNKNTFYWYTAIELIADRGGYISNKNVSWVSKLDNHGYMQFQLFGIGVF